MKEISGKVAFVTGGSSGIGLGIARAFVSAGMKVIVSYRQREHLDEALRQFETVGDRVHAIQVDVTDRDGLQQAADEATALFGNIHVLVNNAGIQNTASLSNVSYEDWDRLMAVNVTGVLNGVRTFLPRIQAHGEGGHVVSIASISGLAVDGPGYGAYFASKFAVVGMMESLRMDLSGTNVGVSVCCPGIVKSNLEKGLKDLPMASDPYEVGELVVRGIYRNALYILTHPEFEGLIEARSKALLAAMPLDVHPAMDRKEFARDRTARSIYVRELETLPISGT